VVEGTPEQAAAEAAAVRRFTEARYDASGTRYEPVWQLAATEPCEFPLGPEDVLLVTGGGKGIGAECAIEAARKSGARLLILGTSAPGDNPNLERMRALGLRVEYRRADVTDATSIGPLPEVTAILHAAGINHPHPIEAIEETGFQRTLAVKVGGLRNILGAVDSSKLKLLVAFGSIIGRIGMAGEADYAVANEWLARGVEQFGAAQPACRCLTLEWSVWSGTGMGERLARLEALRRAGVSPISIEEGVRAFREALSSGARGTLVVTGRFGEPATAQFDAAELPLLRYLERTRVHYPGVELVCEAGLSTTSDPYLDDHVYSGARLLPGVMALEAMAQAAMAAAGSDASPSFENVRFLRPVIVPADGSLTIRLAALVRAPGEIEVCIRSAETGFQAEHFRATCRFGAAHSDPSLALAKDPHAAALDPARHLYGGLLFQEGRFRRLRSYSRLRAAECIAEAAAGRQSGWFSRYLPQTLVLGDPGVRDAAIHAIQACIPHARVLPGGARAIWSRPHAVPESYEIRARERRREGDLLVYDMEIATPGGEVVERWSGMELRIVGAAALPLRWPAALLAPYLERRIGEIVPRAVVSVGLETNGQAHGFAAAGNPDVCNPDVTRRPDGKPMGNGRHVSRSHAGQLTMTVTGASEVGCDCEAVRPRPAETWRGLLGADGFALAKLMARETREPLDASATRVWSAFECMKKAGARYGLGIVLSTSGDAGAGSEGGWVVLGAGASRIATLVAPVEGFEDPLAFAVLLGPG
jgi:enediyne polyketide synthase